MCHLLLCGQKSLQCVHLYGTSRTHETRIVASSYLPGLRKESGEEHGDLGVGQMEGDHASDSCTFLKAWNGETVMP